MNERLLRVSDIAPELGITTGRVYQLIGQGSIPAIRIGGRIRIRETDWERWLIQQIETKCDEGQEKRIAQKRE